MNEDRNTNQGIGQRLKLARINSGKSILELCDAHDTQCTCELLEAYEQGRAIIPASKLASLAETLQLPAQFFLQGQSLIDCSGEWQLLHAFRVLDRASQDKVMRLVLEVATDVAISRS